MHELRTEHPPQSSTAAFIQCPDHSNLQKHKSKVPLAFQVLAFRGERGKSRRPLRTSQPLSFPLLPTWAHRLGMLCCPFLSLSLAVPLQVLHFTATKSLSRAPSSRVRAHQPPRAAVTPAQRQGCEPEPPELAKFCPAACHMLPEPSCEHSRNPAYCPCHQTEEAFKLEGLCAFCILFQFVFCRCCFVFSSSDSCFLAKGETNLQD